MDKSLRVCTLLSMLGVNFECLHYDVCASVFVY